MGNTKKNQSPINVSRDGFCHLRSFFSSLVCMFYHPWLLRGWLTADLSLWLGGGVYGWLHSCPYGDVLASVWVRMHLDVNLIVVCGVSVAEGYPRYDEGLQPGWYFIWRSGSICSHVVLLLVSCRWCRCSQIWWWTWWPWPSRASESSWSRQSSSTSWWRFGCGSVSVSSDHELRQGRVQSRQQGNCDWRLCRQYPFHSRVPTVSVH